MDRIDCSVSGPTCKLMVLGLSSLILCDDHGPKEAVSPGRPSTSQANLMSA